MACKKSGPESSPFRSPFSSPLQPVVAVFLVASSIHAHSALAADTPTLCQPDEQVYFSCPVKKSNLGPGGAGKTVSLCASQTLSAKEGYLQYRFGTPGRIELSYPEQRQGSQQQFLFSSVGSQDVYTTLRFIRGQYEYLLQSARQQTKPGDGKWPVRRSLMARPPEGAAMNWSCDEDRTQDRLAELADIAIADDGREPEPAKAIKATKPASAGGKKTDAEKTPRLCREGEKTLFSCRLENSKQVVSLCASSSLSSGEGYLQFRQGSPAKVTKQFPATETADSLRKFTYTQYSRYQVSQQEIGFKDGKYRYRIYDAYAGDTPGEKPERHHGLTRTPLDPDGKEHDQPCAGPVVSEMNASLRDILSCDPDSALEMGGCGAGKK